MRGGEYISAILPWAVTSKADPTLSDIMFTPSAKSSTGVLAALLRLVAAARTSVGASAKSSTVVSAVLFVTRVGGTAVSGAGALLELERPAVAELLAVASISKSSSGSGIVLFLLGVSTCIGASLFIGAGAISGALIPTRL